jgi:hypothetical protein
MTSGNETPFSAVPGSLVLFTDPHRESPQRPGFNQVGVVLPQGRIVFIRAGRAVELDAHQLERLPAAVAGFTVPGLTEKVAAFFSRERRRPRLIAAGLKAIEAGKYGVFESAELMPVFRRILPQHEYDAAWQRVISKLRRGDAVFIFEHNSFLDSLIAWLDHVRGVTWPHTLGTG